MYIKAAFFEAYGTHLEANRAADRPTDEYFSEKSYNL